MHPFSRLALFVVVALPSTGSALPLMDFDRTTGPDYVADSFAGNAFYTRPAGVIGDAVRIGGTSAGGGRIWNVLPQTNLNAYRNQPLELRAMVEAGSSMYNYTVILMEEGSDYIYHYSFATRDLGQGAFAWTSGRTLNNPHFVLDTKNGYSFVGAGPNFAPSLTRVTLIGIESNYAAPSNLANRIVFDELRVAAVPEPASMLALGTGALVLLRKRRQPR